MSRQYLKTVKMVPHTEKSSNFSVCADEASTRKKYLKLLIIKETISHLSNWGNAKSSKR